MRPSMYSNPKHPVMNIRGGWYGLIKTTLEWCRMIITISTEAPIGIIDAIADWSKGDG